MIFNCLRSTIVPYMVSTMEDHMKKTKISSISMKKYIDFIFSRFPNVSGLCLLLACSSCWLDLNEIELFYGNTSLHLICQTTEHQKTIALLINSGCHMNCLNKDEKSQEFCSYQNQLQFISNVYAHASLLLIVFIQEALHHQLQPVTAGPEGGIIPYFRKLVLSLPPIWEKTCVRLSPFWQAIVWNFLLFREKMYLKSCSVL